MSKRYSRYKKVFAKKSRRYNIKHIKKGAPRIYRYRCRLAHMFLIKNGGYKSNNWLKLHHEPMRRKIPVENALYVLSHFVENRANDNTIDFESFVNEQGYSMEELEKLSEDVELE